MNLLTKRDYKKWLTNAGIFIAPVAVIYLGSVVNAIGDGGFQWTDFSVNTIVAGSMILYVVNTILDFFRKLASSNANG